MIIYVKLDSTIVGFIFRGAGESGDYAIINAQIKDSDYPSLLNAINLNQ